MEADQWKQGGDCSICRRKKYCRKACTKHKQWMAAAIRQVFAQTKAGKAMAAMKQATGEEYADG